MDFVEKIKEAVTGHSEEVEKGIDAVGDAIDQATGGQFAAQVDQAQDFLKDQVDNLTPGE